MTYTHSTHLMEFSNGYTQLAVVCGKYCRRLHTYSSGNVRLTAWNRIREGVTLTPCVAPIVEVVKDQDQHSYADILR